MAIDPISSVSAAQIEKVPVTTLDQALKGRSPGVQVTNNDASPGGDLKTLKSERGTDGVWTITTAPGLNPSVYRYFFLVDGNEVNDPKNPTVSDFRPMVDIVPISFHHPMFGSDNP